MKNIIPFTWACLSFVLLGNTCFAQDFDGYALYNESNNNTTYLIDKDGDIAKTWNNTRPCNYAVQLMPNGNLMRGAVNQSNLINGAAVGGTVQEIDPNANVVWEFNYSSSTFVSHHDIAITPQGTVFLIAWEVKNSTELLAAGYTGNTTQKMPTHIIEVEQNGTGGQIIWEWHMWDHMIQDVDPSKPNFGVVANHPELMDINVATSSTGGGPGGGSGDWFHCNGIDYNPSLDLIAISSRYLSELFIIDHSTTSAEAAGHTGGNYGKGGDFLFRWGNPGNYDHSAPKSIAGAVHDIRWIKNDGGPNDGWIQYFNNVGGPGGSSVVDAINPPLDANGFEYIAGVGFSPTAGEEWRHECLDNANGQSASDRLPNGNTFVNLSQGYMYEVDIDGNTVWQYNAGPAKGFRYTCDYPGIINLLNDPCNILSSSKNVSLPNMTIAPNPSSGIFQISGLTEEIAYIKVTNLLGQEVLNTSSATEINLLGANNGIYLVNIHLANGDIATRKVSVLK